MTEFRYIPPGQSAQRARAKSLRTDAPTRPVQMPRQRNVEQVLSLGDVRYITYRNQTYRIPPVPFKLGQRALHSYVRSLAHAKQVAQTGAKEPTDAYYKELATLATILWKHIRPIGRVRRLCWGLGLSRNPFKRASEGEMKEITDFFLQGRTMSSVQCISAAEAQA